MRLYVATLSRVPGPTTVMRQVWPKSNTAHNFVVPTVASSIDLVVHVRTDRHGHRRVREIVAVPGRVEGDVVEVAQVFETRDNRLVRADGYPPHRDRFAQAGYDLTALLAADGAAV